MVKRGVKESISSETPIWKCKKWWFFFFALAIFLISSFSIIVNKGLGSSTLIQDYELILLSLSCAIMGIFCYRKIHENFPIERKFILFLTSAMFLRFLGEILWAYYEIIKNSTPVISFADVAWYTSYFMIFIALGYKIKKTFIMNKEKILSFSLATAFGISALLIYFNIPLNLRGTEILLPIVLNFYIIFDLFVLALLFVLIIPAFGGYNKAIRYLFLLFLGFISFAIFDFLFAEMTLLGTYNGGEEITILYSLAYILVLAGITLKYSFIDQEND